MMIHFRNDNLLSIMGNPLIISMAPRRKNNSLARAIDDKMGSVKPELSQQPKPLPSTHNGFTTTVKPYQFITEGENMKKMRKLLVLSCLAVFLIISVARPGLGAEEIRFGYVNWPGVTVKTYVAVEVLKLMGYETDMKMLSVPVVFRGLAGNDLDLFLGAWLPTMKSISEKYFDEGSIVTVAVNLDETVYTLAVPEYVWKAGVKSHADLDKFADKFDKKIIGIEPGNDGNKLVLDMIKNDTYGLGDWKLIESSAEAMMISVGSAIKKNEWVVWLGWSPHWMNLAYDIKFLEDPQHIWGSEPEIVKTVARAGLEKDNPNIYKLFSQFKVTPEIQNEWIDKYSRGKEKPEKVAQKWIKDNIKVVDQWVYGVTAPDGQRARSAIRKSLGM